MDARCRLVLLQFICLIWPSPPHVTVDSFVLRRRSAVDDDQPLSDALYAVERPGLSYVDDVDQYDLLPQYVEDYDVNIPGDYDDDDEVAEKLMDIIKQERMEEAAEQDYSDFNDRDYVDYDDETWAGSPILNTEDYDSANDNDDSGSQPGKMTLDKAQLREIFTGSNVPIEDDVEKQTTELSKNEVKKLFDTTSAESNAEDEVDTENSPNLDDKESEIEIKVPVDSETNVDKIVKSIEEVKSDNDDVVGGKLVDVKETVLPENGKQLTKEWMVELVQTEPPHLDGSSRKSKRSMDVQSEEDDFEVAAKQRAVDLLKTYIELQEEENRHLTEALNFATLAQTQRTDRYIDDEIGQLRQAVSDEAAIETLRDMIKADENVDDGIKEQEEENETEEEEAEEEEQERDEAYNNIPPLDYVPVKRDSRELSEMLVPSTLAEEDTDFTDNEARKYQLNVFLRERLRQYLLKKELESNQNLIDDEDDYDVNNEWLMSKLSPSFVNIYSDSQLNPFTREIEEIDKRSDSDYIDEDSEDDGYMRDPSWLKDIETAAAIAKLYDTTQVSNAYDDTDVCPAVYELTDDCSAARQRRLTLDDEATQLCNRHQLCYTCGAEFGLAADTCDEGYLQESDRLCSKQSVTGRSLGRCRGEAAGLFVIMIQEHNYTPPDVTPSICRQRCAYDFIVTGR